MKERLQKIIAAAGICSRRAAEELLRQGRVRVNGQSAALGDQADPESDIVTVDGQPLRRDTRRVYLMLNKPRGYVTTLSDERGRRTAAELVSGCGARVYPVGRLDMDSEGLLLMTNDGAWMQRLLHPSHQIEKEYRVTVTGPVEGAAQRLTVPGIGGECGSTLGNNRLLYQGLFLAPHTVAQAVKTAVFAARVMELLGYETEPHSSAVRHDIIQMIHTREPEALKKFCKGIQFGAPVDSYVTPEPWDMPGYDCPVIMAAGAFIQGASIELSADAPMRPPYTVYLQGGLTFESGKLGVLLAAEELLRA